MLTERHVLLFSIFIAGLCSIIYELLIATTGSYFLGDSVTQFSLTIGIYMAFMGVGSWLSRWVNDTNLLEYFIGFELVLALFGGTSVPLLYFSYASELPLQLISAVLTAVIGVLIGLEIPLLSRLMEKHYSLKANLSNVLSVDYFGALLATLVFPFLLLPWLGIFKTSLAFGLVNLSIATTLLWYFAPNMHSRKRRMLKSSLVAVSILLLLMMGFSKTLNQHWNSQVYEDRIVHSQQSQYQQIVLTRHKEDIRLYLNGGLQFSSIDEYRYHESLVHPAMTRMQSAVNVLILGGGDGLAVRELLKYPDIQHITLVDLDPAIAALARNHHYLRQLNQNALHHPKVRIIHQDAFVFSKQNKALYDVILIDLPDPKTISLARLYSQQFYQSLRHHLAPQGIMVTQATSPFFATEAFWSIKHTIQAAGFPLVTPYHLNIPSFGEWGFVMACNTQCQPQRELPVQGRYYQPEMEHGMLNFAKDMLSENPQISTLDQPHILYQYIQGWKYWN